MHLTNALLMMQNAIFENAQVLFLILWRIAKRKTIRVCRRILTCSAAEVQHDVAKENILVYTD